MTILPNDRDASGRDLGERELEFLFEVIRSGTLNCTKGTFTKRLELAFAATTRKKRAVACASGTAAIHAALAALRLQAGDEVLTSPITDMGAVMPILYEGAVPVFCDVDPATCNVTAQTLAERITERTKAIVVTHLFGNPAEMAPIVRLAREAGAALIEDCAQAFLASDDGQLVGTFGDLACYSFQQGKHMTTGEGGMVTTDDQELADRVERFVNKGWGYGDAKPDHDRPGLNYRLTELQSAVGLAQLEKLEGCVARRRKSAAVLTELLKGQPGLETPRIRPGSQHSYWRYTLLVDPSFVAGGTDALGARLRESGVACLPRYIQKPAFECAVFGRERARYLVMRNAREEHRESFPGAVLGLERILVLPWNERYEDSHVRFVADSVRVAATALRR